MTLIDVEQINKTPKRANYFVRHWRGELSLGISYWVNGFLGNVALFSVIMVLAAYLNSSNSNYSFAIYWILVYLFTALVVTWQVVGISRSANRHMANTGRKGWARVAIILAIIGVFRFVTDFVGTGIPAISEGFQQGEWLAKNAKWEIHLLRDGTEVELSGGIGHGMVDDFAKILEAAPNIQVVHVNLSLGGLVDEATRVQDLIRQRGLATYTSSQCVSACSIVFLGGKERYLRSGAQLGFHAYKIPGISDKDADFTTAKRQLAEEGISKAFVDKIFQTSHTDMWFPSEKELKDAGVITAAVSGDEFGISGFKRSSDRAALENGLLQIKLYRAIKHREPEIYKAIVDEFVGGIHSGKSVDDMRPQMAGRIRMLRDRYLRYASDASVIAFGNLILAQMDYLRNEPDGICFAYVMRGDAASTNAAIKLLPANLKENELDVMADIIESADLGRKTPKKSEVDQIMSNVGKRTMSTLGENAWVLGKLNDPNIDPALGCQAVRELYGSIMVLPPREAGIVLRNILGGKS